MTNAIVWLAFVSDAPIAMAAIPLQHKKEDDTSDEDAAGYTVWERDIAFRILFRTWVCTDTTALVVHPTSVSFCAPHMERGRGRIHHPFATHRLSVDER